MAQRQPNLREWQWSLYPDNHTDRLNLILHVVAVPLFWLGAMAIVMALFTTWQLAVSGAVTMALAMALQGIGHRREPVPPVPFDGPGDAVKRIFVEQFLTFPRYAMSSRMKDAWTKRGR